MVPFDSVKTYQNDNKPDTLEYSDQEATGLSCIKCCHGFAQYLWKNVTILSIAAERCLTHIDCGVISTDVELSVSGVISSGVVL